MSFARVVAATVALVSAVGLTNASGASTLRSPAAFRTHGQAERDVLRALNRGWGRRLPALFNSRTHLLRNNTQAICRRIRPAGGSTRFVCVVRPAVHRRHQGLYLMYRARPARRFALRWLYYRAGS
jgi:hypothetical protein